MIIKDIKEAGNYLSDRELNLYNSQKYKKSYLRNILKSVKTKDEFLLLELSNNIGIVFEYEIAWESYVNEKDMIKMENLLNSKLSELNISKVYFYLSRHSGNIEKSLMIHAFIKEEDLKYFTLTYLNNITDYMINFVKKYIK